MVTDALYAELKPDIGAVVEPLFDMSKLLLRKQGNFLPHGAVLTEEGEFVFVILGPGALDDDWTNAPAVLPVLHEALRQKARERSLRALGVAEQVTVTQEGQRPTRAIKVLFEHRRGLSVALYLPFQKKFFRRYVVGSSFAVAAQPEVSAWVRDDP